MSHTSGKLLDPLRHGRLQRHDAEGQRAAATKEGPGVHYPRSKLNSSSTRTSTSRMTSAIRRGLSALRLPQRERRIFEISPAWSKPNPKATSPTQRIQGNGLRSELLRGRHVYGTYNKTFSSDKHNLTLIAGYNYRSQVLPRPENGPQRAASGRPLGLQPRHGHDHRPHGRPQRIPLSQVWFTARPTITRANTCSR